MPPAEFDQTTVTLAAPTKGGDAVFRATGRKLVFDGFMKVAGVSSEDQLLPDLSREAAGLLRSSLTRRSTSRSRRRALPRPAW